MVAERTDKPVEAIWRPVRDLPLECREWRHEGARAAASAWADARRRLEDRSRDRALLDEWLVAERRAFAIETGQVEDLYRLAQGITEQLIMEGFEGVRGAHSVTAIDDNTLRGLLQDQQTTLELVFEAVKEGRPLSNFFIRELHALLTRHQESAVGVTQDGRRVAVPLLHGEYKQRPNNPRRRDGHVHEYCPPEQVRSEMDRFLEFHRGHRDLGLAPEVEAAWLHHEFVRIHPFQDGNGRMSRLLVAWAYAKAGEFPPIVKKQDKLNYIQALESADGGDFRAFVNYLGDQAAARSREAAAMVRSILDGNRHRRHGNGYHAYLKIC